MEDMSGIVNELPFTRGVTMLKRMLYSALTLAFVCGIFMAASSVAMAECHTCKLVSQDPHDEDCVDAPPNMRGSEACNESGEFCTLGALTCWGPPNFAYLDADGSLRPPPGLFKKLEDTGTASDGVLRMCSGAIVARTLSEARSEELKRNSAELAL